MVDIKQEIEVYALGADTPKPKLNWTVREYIGSEILDLNQKTINVKEDLLIGQEIYVPGLFGWIKMVVKCNGGSIYAESEHMLSALCFGEDDRNAWVCGGLINKRGLKKLEINSDEK